MTEIKFDPTKPVQTRDGRKARIVCTDRVGHTNLVALVMTDYFEAVYSYYSTGKHISGNDGADLVNVPEKRWVNLYEKRAGFTLFTSEENALKTILKGEQDYGKYIKTIEVEL